MSDLFFTLLFGAGGTLLLVFRDRVVASNLEANRRWPVLRRFPILGRLSRLYDSERFQRRQTTFGAIVLLAMAAISLIDWVVSR
jgi:hypothetical protein